MSDRGNISKGPEREIEISKFWVSRRGDALITRIVIYRGRPFVDFRRYYTDKSGKFAPTKKGFLLALRKLPELRRAIEKADQEARAENLVHGEDEAGE
jgi:hypothetical protein